MTQLIIGDLTLPESKKGYAVTREPLGKFIRMISGRLVEESRGFITKIEYQYDYLQGDDFVRHLLTALRSGALLTVQYLGPEGDALQAGLFRCTQRPNPKYAFHRGPRIFWHDISFTLEEEGAH